MQVARQALEGVKVADFSWIIAGPLTAKFLGDLGAEVIHIESYTNPDNLRSISPMRDGVSGINRSATFARYNSSKYGLSLNLKHPKGLQIARRIVAWADIALENFTPGVMERLGLGYEDLKKVKPDIVMLSMPLLGHAGPLATHPGLGVQLSDLIGFGNITGWPDREPSTLPGAYTDFIGPYYALVALMAALDYRSRTGKGQYIELAQFEAGLQFIAPLIMDWTANGREPIRRGNECDHAVPHGVYACQGEERWCAIAVFSDEEWQALCRVIGDPALFDEPRFATLLGRKENAREIDRLIEGWTANHTAEEVMAKLQEAGVPAGVVANGKDLFEDPQLETRGFYKELVHAEIGPHHYPSPPFKLSRTPGEPRMPSPCLGQHNEYVCKQILGMSDEEFVEMLNEGVFE
ncbi:MAG: CoA transferase [Chloroflexi bacterium]|nr:MAG: CoA transferase [Chloroflexota bacterium]